MLYTLIIISLVGLFLISWWMSHRQRIARSRRLTVAEYHGDRRSTKRANRDPEEQYIEGVGYVIGDVSCKYNAKSPYVRCAINPTGLCQDCRHFESHEE